MALRRSRKALDPSVPNIIWVGDGSPPEQFQSGMEPLEVLPPEAAQRAGFFSENAALLFQIHRPNYKKLLNGKAVDEPDNVGLPGKDSEALQPPVDEKKPKKTDEGGK
jgi:hypothetical protein